MQRRSCQHWVLWGLAAAAVALSVTMCVTRSGLRTWSAPSGLSVGVGQGCVFVGRVPALAGQGRATWAGIYPEWRFRWHTYPGEGWGLFIPIWAMLLLIAAAAGLVWRAGRRRRAATARA